MKMKEVFAAFLDRLHRTTTANGLPLTAQKYDSARADWLGEVQQLINAMALTDTSLRYIRAEDSRIPHIS